MHLSDDVYCIDDSRTMRFVPATAETKAHYVCPRCGSTTPQPQSSIPLLMLITGMAPSELLLEGPEIRTHFVEPV